MEEIAGIFNSIGLVLTAILGGFGVISLSVAALLYMNAHGDPQQVNKAKTAAIGAIIGLIMGGMAWVLPGIISRAIVEPSGGQSLTSSGSVQGCDRIFKSQLVSQRQVNTAARMNELISTIQNTRDECRPDTWNPQAEDLKTGLNAETGAGGRQECIVGGSDGPPKTNYKYVAANKSTWPAAQVGGLGVPIGLRVAGNQTYVPISTSGRDRDNNILVYFYDKKDKTTNPTGSREGSLPGDGAVCWLYLARASAWASGPAPSAP